MSDSYNAVGRVYYCDCNVSGETSISLFAFCFNCARRVTPSHVVAYAVLLFKRDFPPWRATAEIVRSYCVVNLFLVSMQVINCTNPSTIHRYKGNLNRAADIIILNILFANRKIASIAWIRALNLLGR